MTEINPNNLPAPAPKDETLNSLIVKSANRWKVEPKKYIDTLKQTVFKPGRDGQPITEAQLYMLLFIIESFKLNPFTRELHAYPDRNGIVPILGIDGWVTLIHRNSKFNGLSFNQAEEFMELDEHHKPCPAWMQCNIFLKGHQQPVSIVEYFDEVYRAPFVSHKTGEIIPGPWQSHTKRMLRHKAMIQCARIAFGYGGLYDPDEGQKILDAKPFANEQNHEPVISYQPTAQITHQATQELKQKLEAAREAAMPKPKASGTGTATQAASKTPVETKKPQPPKSPPPKPSEASPKQCKEADEFFKAADAGAKKK